MLSKNKTILFVGLFFFSNISYSSVADDDKVTCNDFLKYAGFFCLGCCIYCAEANDVDTVVKDFVGIKPLISKTHKPCVIDSDDAILHKQQEHKKNN